MKRSCHFGVAFLMVIGLLAPVVAQVTTVSLEGKVVDNENNAVPGTAIMVKNAATGLVRGASSDAEGRYRILGIPPGSYTVQAQHIGYKTATRENVRFLTGQRPVLDFVLVSDAVQLGEVQVIGQRVAEFELTRVDVSTPVVRDQIVNLPLNSRSALNLAGLAPGIRTYAPTAGRSLPSSGSLPDLRFINFYVDGAEWKSMFNGNIVGIPQTGSPLPQEAIEEFRVILTPFDTEFTRGGSWVINALTRRGTNEFHAEAFSFFRDRELNARGPFEQKKPDFNRQQVGLNFSGPLMQDKLFFAGSYELHNTNDFIDVVPGRPAFNPGIWDRYRGTFSAPNKNHTGVARLTYQPVSTHSLDLIWSSRYLESKTFFGGTAAEPAGIFGKYHINSVMLKHTWLASNNAFNELSVQYLRWRHHEPTINTGPAYVYPSVRLGRGTFPIKVAEDHYRLINKFSVKVDDLAGPHLLKIGGEVTRVSMTPWFPSYLYPEFTFATDSSALPRTASIGIGLLHPLDPNGSDAETDDKGTLVGVYVQDQWNPTPRLTLNLGVRYDVEINTLNNKQRLPWADSTVLVNALPAGAINTGNRRNDTDNLAPRFSFNYDVGGDGRTILRGGYGITFDRTAYFIAYFEKRDAFWRTYQFINPGTLDPEVLRQRVASGGGSSAPTMNLLANKMSTPQINQFSLGLGRQLTDRLALNIDYINQRASGLYASLNANYFSPALNRRVISSRFGDVILWGSIARAHFHGFLTNLAYRTAKARLSASYTLSWAES
ncbi:MAG: TonB-dependent receptor, partial [candidate division KSB1 bacterium]|nr:TonB-dependent receptor [candidate division KSB1 bacterium]